MPAKRVPKTSDTLVVVFHVIEAYQLGGRIGPPSGIRVTPSRWDSLGQLLQIMSLPRFLDGNEHEVSFTKPFSAAL